MKNFFDSDSRLSACTDNVFTGDAEQLHDLVFYLVGHGAFEIYFVEYGNDLQIVFDGHVDVRYGLCLDALGRIDHQQSPFAGGDGA